jgi:Tol biopolymer transport system component
MWKVSAAGSDAQALFDLISGEVFGWSPDGTRVLYAGGPGINPDGTPIGTPVPGGPFSLWLMDPNGQNQRPLSRLSLSSWGFDPVWSPDSQWIALTDQDEDQEFGCYRTTPPPDPENCQFEGAAIYIENVVTGEVRRLATGIEPVWSPDGSRLAFLSIQSGATEIWTIKTDGTDLQQLTADGQTKNSRLSWSR